MQSSLATMRRVAYEGLDARTPRKAVVLHTNGFDATAGSLFSGFSKNARGDNGPDFLHVGAHFQVKNDGTIEQYVDTDLSIGHAFAANSFAIGIETEDDGHCLRAWTDAQVDSIVALLRELGIPPKLLEETASDGIGWHRKFDSWNKNNHACPCDTRQEQITSRILPELEDDMSKANEYFEKLERDGVDPSQYSAVVRFEWGYQRGLRRRPLGTADAADPVKKAGFEHGVKEATASRTPRPRVPTPRTGASTRRGREGSTSRSAKSRGSR
jgi:N-acetylmuramoyl-L-alanine amidase